MDKEAIRKLVIEIVARQLNRRPEEINDDVIIPDMIIFFLEFGKLGSHQTLFARKDFRDFTVGAVAERINEIINN